MPARQADPYRYCADYGSGRGGLGATNCYFLTLEQCRMAASAAPHANQHDGVPAAPAARRRTTDTAYRHVHAASGIMPIADRALSGVGGHLHATITCLYDGVPVDGQPAKRARKDAPRNSLTEDTMMRIIFADCRCCSCAAAFATPAQADPYRWCAHYSGEGGGGSNCYFLTIEQCRAAISGVGGHCGPNPFYDGVPVDGSGAPRVRRALKNSSTVHSGDAAISAARASLTRYGGGPRNPENAGIFDVSGFRRSRLRRAAE